MTQKNDWIAIHISQIIHQKQSDKQKIENSQEVTQKENQLHQLCQKLLKMIEINGRSIQKYKNANY